MNLARLTLVQHLFNLYYGICAFCSTENQTFFKLFRANAEHSLWILFLLKTTNKNMTFNFKWTDLTTNIAMWSIIGNYIEVKFFM